ncbi:hypothetical protein F2Q69_00006048 [Brassica cretica]|uniref:Uncharacterized protein n=1 Tax=Brassica cretica TaxID=69181 RepID=A0A8S9NTS9_BRACR|nr:hypothetical protein F2Q69_00006048 [Brassica cretica]
MGTTAQRKQHVQEFYSGTKNQQGYLQVPRRTRRTSLCRRSGYNPKTTQEATTITSKLQGASSSRGASKAIGIKHENPQFRPPGLIKPPHPPNP